jgi:pimeloyl-ACP methyl ester carboxylesterase
MEFSMTITVPKPFVVDVPQAKIDAIVDRVRAYRWFDAPRGEAQFGVSTDFMQRLAFHWTNRYDWRKHESELNRYPQFQVDIDDNTVHYIHERGSGSASKPLVLLHGWPYTHAGFLPLIDRLAHPERFGGRAEDGVDVVVPSLPGFGFSNRLARPLGPRATADLLNSLMTDVLGYEQYLLHGGDWGAIVADWTAVRHRDQVLGLHLNLGFTRHDGAAFGSGETGPGPSTLCERAWASAEMDAVEREFAYFQLQASDPLTISYALMDSPVGLAAWVIEKFLHWSDSRTHGPEQVFSMDSLITEVMLYLITDSFYTATTLYRAIVDEGPTTLPPGERIDTPTSFAAFPDPHCPPPPRSILERSHNIVHWTDMPRGGHFPAMEVPELILGDLQRFATATH